MQAIIRCKKTQATGDWIKVQTYKLKANETEQKKKIYKLGLVPNGTSITYGKENTVLLLLYRILAFSKVWVSHFA